MSDAVIKSLQDAMALQIDGKLDEAESIYQQILARDPDNADANHLLGLVRSEQDRNDDAVALIEKAISINDKAAAFHHNIAGIYRRIGRLDDAEREFRRAIELKPDYGEAYQGLAEMVKFTRDDPFIRQLLAQLNSGNLEDRVKCYFHFAAGKFLDDVGEYAAAFEHYRLGNRAANKPFDSAEFRQQIKDTIYVFSHSLVDRLPDVGNPSPRPVFVVGMPRSGSTLVEQIISSHSGVHGAGELNDMKFIARSASELSQARAPWPNCVPGLTPSVLGRLGADYLARIDALAEGTAERVVDKHPLNFQFIGLILMMLPNAQIIHTRRDPLDTCLSCFFQNFTKGQHYSFDLHKLAHFYNDYRRLMEHWDALFPGRILHVDYEDVVADQEAQTRRLLDFCGLDFEQACLDFHKTDRVVKTASFMQVRKPLYKSSQNRWRNYTRELADVAAILGIPLAQPVTITATSPILR